MKVAVYTIALNEEKFVGRWYKSAKEADFLLVADTGSSDETVRECDERNIYCPKVIVKPWRFDDARNAALALLPANIDYCIVLDMDEVLAPGWREEIERCAELGATRLRYRYVWSHKEDGSDGLQFYRDGLHCRHGYRWKHPVHEILVPDRIEEKLIESTLTVHHWPDNSKSRGQYLPLLAQSVKEDPYDDRNAYYYARELYFTGDMVAAEAEFKRHLGLPTAKWPPERAASLRWLAKIKPESAEQLLMLAVETDPGRREARVELAAHYYMARDWEHSREWALSALLIENRPLDYLCEDFAWGSSPDDYAAIASYNLGDFESAFRHGIKAVDLSPEDERLKRNNTYYMSALRNR
jgi:tetratricopeptide (TPR) repeat protein